MKYYLLSILFSITLYSNGGIDKLLPKPQQISPNNQRFYLDQLSLSTPFWGDQWMAFCKDNKVTFLDDAYKKIEISIVDSLSQIPVNEDEGYTLIVTDSTIQVQALNKRGVYWALQTLRQLVVEDSIQNYVEGCTIIDYPAFRIRGFMQDVGRTYISIDELKREIKKLSEYKINVFHWHLTENQGWRLQSKCYPKLNAPINYERMPGKYYTLEEAKDLVTYCKQHNVLLIPEIDMPGHSRAFTTTFGYDMQSQQGIETLKRLMDEVCETFDVPFIHIGTDEVEFTNPNFVPTMVDYIRSKGKKLISWNPGWNYKVGEIDMTHLWSYRGTPQVGIPAIDSRLHYINHFDAFADIISLYNSRILNTDRGSYDMAGSIIALWHDRNIESEEDILLQNAFYPAMLALSERAWLGGGTEYYDVYGTILPPTDTPEFKSFQDFERRMCWHKEHNFCGFPFAYIEQTDVKWRITDPFPNNGNLANFFPPEDKIAKNYHYQGKEYKTREVIGAGVYLRHVWGNNTVRSFYEDPQPNHTAYAYTYVYSDLKQEVGLWLAFQNYSRSEKDLPPQQGKWDDKESRIWINDSEILPPHWQSQHTELSNEIPLTNENFQVRPPIPVQLKKGWNKVLLKLPVAKFSTPNVRLVKWMFNCVFVNLDGNAKAKGLIYSPDKIR